MLDWYVTTALERYHEQIDDLARVHKFPAARRERRERRVVAVVVSRSGLYLVKLGRRMQTWSGADNSYKDPAMLVIRASMTSHGHHDS